MLTFRILHRSRFACFPICVRFGKKFVEPTTGPIPRAVQTVARRLAVPVPSGLHHQYFRAYVSDRDSKLNSVRRFSTTQQYETCYKCSE
jgi:hypothetical protein